MVAVDFVKSCLKGQFLIHIWSFFISISIRIWFDFGFAPFNLVLVSSNKKIHLPFRKYIQITGDFFSSITLWCGRKVWITYHEIVGIIFGCQNKIRYFLETLLQILPNSIGNVLTNYSTWYIVNIGQEWSGCKILKMKK